MPLFVWRSQLKARVGFANTPSGLSRQGLYQNHCLGGSLGILCAAQVHGYLYYNLYTAIRLVAPTHASQFASRFQWWRHTTYSMCAYLQYVQVVQ